MKRILALLLAFVLVFGMTACGDKGPKPEDTVKKFCEAMKTMDYQTMQACMSGELETDDLLDTEEDTMPGLTEFVKQAASELTYKIGAAEVSEDKAEVGVSFEYTDISPVLQQAFSDYFVKLLGALFSDLSDEESAAMFEESFASAKESTKTTRGTAEATLKLALQDGEWKIADLPEELVTVMTGNLLGALEGLTDLFDTGDSDWSSGAEAVDYPIADEVLVDNEAVTMTVVSGGTDDWGDVVFNVLCENNSDKDYTFTIDDVVVNGWKVSGYFYEDVAPGKKSNAELTIDGSSLEEAGIESPDKVELLVRVYNDEDWWDDILLVDDTCVIYPTGLSDAQITVPARPTRSGETVVEDNDLFTLIILGEAENSWNYALDVYVKNKTDRMIDIDWEDVSVNDFMCEPYWSVSLRAGQQTVSQVSFMSDDFEDNGIETVEKIEFTLEVTDNTTWDTIYSQDHTYTPQ